MIAHTPHAENPPQKRRLGPRKIYEMLYKISFNIICKMTLRVRRVESSNCAPS